MGWQTMGAYTDATIQATDILFILFSGFMIGATGKELLSIEGFQPRRLLNSLLKQQNLLSDYIYEPKRQEELCHRETESGQRQTMIT